MPHWGKPHFEGIACSVQYRLRVFSRSFELIEHITVTHGLILLIYSPAVARRKLSMAWHDGEAIRSLFRIRKKFLNIESPLTFKALRIPAFSSVSIALAERIDRPRPDLIPSLTAVDEPNRAETRRVLLPSQPYSLR